MLVPNTMAYFSSPSPNASNAPKVSTTACHAAPYCALCSRNPMNALLTASQSPLAAIAKNAWNSDGISSAFACASFSATNDFNRAASSGFLSDGTDVRCLWAQPMINSPPPSMTAPSDLIVAFIFLRLIAMPLTSQHHLLCTTTE